MATFGETAPVTYNLLNKALDFLYTELWYEPVENLTLIQKELGLLTGQEIGNFILNALADEVDDKTVARGR